MISRWLMVGLAFLLLAGNSLAAETASQVIDRLIQAKWTKGKVQPAALADDAEFVRRIYLDLIGRIPCKDELQPFLGDKAADKRMKLIDRLIASGEFAQHWRENLNVLLMGGPAFGGNPEWRAWLLGSLVQNKKWDELARTILRAGPDRPEEAGASVFLVSRMSQGESGVDLVTRDVSRLFFGVDIQCARCHKHPEVDQWTQESYWGMAAYFNRSYPLAVKGKTYLAEKATGEMTFTPKGGKPPRTVAPTFLTGEKLVEPAPPASPPSKPAPAPKPPAPMKPAVALEDPALFLVPPEAAAVKTRVPVPRLSRRARLVDMAVNSRNRYFKQAIVNYLWGQMFGRGLVEPLDQMHDANPASHPELLTFLADDFVAHQYDLRYLIRAIANSQTYQRSSRYPVDRPLPPENTYAVAMVRPLSLHQLANSLMVAAGYYDSFKAGLDAKTRSDPGAVRQRWEAQSLGTLTSLVKNLDTGAEPFQPGIREALFQANSAEFAGFIARGGLATRLAAMKDEAALVRDVYLCTLSRSNTKEEDDRLRGYLKARSDRRAACEQVVWALVTSSEFRFNH
jgi:hypothetical protein